MLIIWGSASALGCSALVQDKRTLSQLYELMNLIRKIRSRIALCREPLNAIYDSFQSPALKRCGFLETLRLSGWKEALSQITLPESCRPLLDTFASELGKSCAEEQLRLCDACIEELDNCYTALKKEFPQKSRMYLALGSSLGLILVIILI